MDQTFGRVQQVFEALHPRWYSASDKNHNTAIFWPTRNCSHPFADKVNMSSTTWPVNNLQLDHNTFLDITLNAMEVVQYTLLCNQHHLITGNTGKPIFPAACFSHYGLTITPTTQVGPTPLIKIVQICNRKQPAKSRARLSCRHQKGQYPPV